MEKEDQVREIIGGVDEEEEEKIDKFYALIRNFREARNHRRRRNELMMISNEADELEMVRKKNKRKYCKESASSSWTPTFELEDFKQDDHYFFIKKPFLQISPHCKKQEEEDRDENGLDLKLTL